MRWSKLLDKWWLNKRQQLKKPVELWYLEIDGIHPLSQENLLQRWRANWFFTENLNFRERRYFHFFKTSLNKLVLIFINYFVRKFCLQWRDLIYGQSQIDVEDSKILTVDTHFLFTLNKPNFRKSSTHFHLKSCRLLLVELASDDQIC